MSHTTVEPETGSEGAPEPIAFLDDGRPVYEEGGRLVAGPNGTPAATGTAGTQRNGTPPANQPAGTSGQNSGGTPASNASTGSAEGSTQAEGVDEGSQNAGGGQQTPEPDLTNLKKAIASERQLRRQAEADLKAERLKNATAEERQLEEAKTAAAAAAEARVKVPLLRSMAAAELRAAGLQGPPNRLVGLLDMEQITIEDNGEVTGLVEQVEALKTEFPNLFQVPTNGARPPAPNANGGSGSQGGRRQDGGAPPREVPFHEQLANIVLTGQPGAGAAMR